MSVGVSYNVDIGVISANTPEVDDTLTHSWLEGEEEVFGAAFLITGVEEIEDGQWTITCTQTEEGDLPDLYELLVNRAKAYVYEVLSEWTEAYEFAPPYDLVTYRRLVVAAGNKIYYENV
jgi:hypothetical protein